MWDNLWKVSSQWSAVLQFPFFYSPFPPPAYGLHWLYLTLQHQLFFSSSSTLLEEGCHVESTCYFSLAAKFPRTLWWRIYMLQPPIPGAMCVWLYFPVLCSVLALVQACGRVVFWGLPGVWGPGELGMLETRERLGLLVKDNKWW